MPRSWTASHCRWLWSASHPSHSGRPPTPSTPLAVQGVPFVLTSGYADWHMAEKWEDRPRLQKPYTIGQIEEALTELFG